MNLDACRGIPSSWSAPALCIVGAGPADLAMAHALLGQTRLRVQILEAGYLT